jgi:YrbI family 3-deoxy-D-manno-octulosonate 8-phosphate phosphatase
LVYEDGKEAVFCNRADGLAIQKIKELDIPQIILSTEENRVVKIRAKKLNIKVIHGIANKKEALVDYCTRKKYNLKNVIYIGNDTNDLKAMKLVGYPIAPQDANDRIKDIAKAIIKKNGGEGVIKEFFENILDF